MSRFCEECGTPLNSNENFCSNCGAKVIRDEPPPVTKPSPTTNATPTSSTQQRVAEFYAKKKAAAQKSKSTPPPETTEHDTESKRNDSSQPPVQATPATSSSKDDNNPEGRFLVKIIGGFFVLAIVIGMMASSSKDTSYSSNKPTQKEDTSVKSQSAPLTEADFELAGLTLGMSKADVEKKLGKPTNGSEDFFNYLNVEVGFENGVVKSVACTNANATPRKICIGDYLSSIEEAYGKDYSHDKDESGDIYTYTLGESALRFVLDKYKRNITRIVIYKTTSQPESATVPDVVGKTQSDAVAALKAAGVEVKISDSYSDSVPAGTIISQSPNSGAKIEKGQTVYVYVSKGVDPAKTPPAENPKPSPPPAPKPASDGYNYTCTVNGTTTYKGIIRNGIACALYDYKTQKRISNEYLSSTARGTFYIVTAIVGNGTNAPIMNPTLYLVDDRGRKYSSNIDATSTYNTIINVELELELNPGQPQYVYEVYDIPDGVNITGLRCEAFTADFDAVEFNLPFRIVTE